LNTKGRLTTDEAKKLPCLSESVRTILKTGRKKTEHDKLVDRPRVLAFTKRLSDSEKAPDSRRHRIRLGGACPTLYWKDRKCRSNVQGNSSPDLLWEVLRSL
jgi:hypothetical protein